MCVRTSRSECQRSKGASVRVRAVFFCWLDSSLFCNVLATAACGSGILHLRVGRVNDEGSCAASLPLPWRRHSADVKADPIHRAEIHFEEGLSLMFFLYTTDLPMHHA